MVANLEVVSGKVFDVIGVADAVIAKMAEDYLPLKINGIDDKEGFKAVHAARMIVKDSRIKVEKKRKELKEDALRYGQAIDKEANRIKALIAPVEEHLDAEENAVEEAKKAIEAEKARQEELRIQARRDLLVALGIQFNGQMWSYQALTLPEPLLKVSSDEQFEKLFAQFNEAVAAEKERLAAEEAARKAESERLAKIAAEQEAERLRLEKVAQEQHDAEVARKAAEEAETRRKEMQERLGRAEQEKRELAIKAEERRIANEKAEWERIKQAELDAIEAAKQKAIDDKRRAEELEKAKQEAAEKARLQAVEDAKREAEEKRQAEERARIAAEKKAAKAPDREKLAIWAESIDSLCNNAPKVNSPEAVDILASAKNGIGRALAILHDMVEELL